MALAIPASKDDLPDSFSIWQQGDDVAIPIRPKLPSNGSVARAPGSTWLTIYHKALWPVVISSEDRLPHGFLAGPRLPGEIPAILLGKHKYTWVVERELQEFDPNVDYLKDVAPFPQPEVQATDDDGTVSEKHRRAAFTRDALEFNDEQFWHNYIANKSKIRQLERQMALEDMREVEIKRKLENERKRKSRKQSRSCDQDYDSTRKKQKTSRMCSKDARLTQPMVGEAQYMALDDRRDSVTGTEQMCKPGTGSVCPPDVPTTHDLRAGQDECRIIVGPRAVNFVVPRGSFQTCPYLRKNVHVTEDLEWVIDLTNESRAVEHCLDDREFLAIHNILCSNSRLYSDLDRRKDSLSERKRNQLAEELGRMYTTAYKLEFEAIEVLVQRQLSALHPLPDLAVLLLAQMICCIPLQPDSSKPEKFLRAWIIDHVACNFDSLQKKYKPTFDGLMADFQDLRKVVTDKVTERVRMQCGAIGR